MITSADIISARETLGETQTAFGARFGVDKSTVWRWENRGVPEHGTTAAALRMLLDNLPRKQAEAS